VESTFNSSLESGSQFCVGVFGTKLVSVAVKTFSHIFQFSKKCYKCRAFNAMCKIMLQELYCCPTQRRFIHFTFYGDETKKGDKT
jgi:hypothetical protein